jgi:ketosteroid isomerase-like protein
MSTFSEFMKEREKAAAAYCQGDGEPVLALSTAREPASFFGPDGKVLRGAESVRNAYETGARQFGRDGESRLEVHQTAEAGDIAYWSGVQRAIVELGGRRVPMDLRVTELFRREDEAWKLVHRHADILKSGE